MELRYSKNCDLDVMMDMLKLEPLSDEFDTVDMTQFKSGHDNIIIKLKRSFFSHEVDKITAIIQSYSTTHELYIRKRLEEAVSVPAMIAGQDIITKYAAMNLYKNKTVPQYFTLFTVTEKLMGYLMTGSLELAMYELGQIRANLPPDGSITEGECDEFLRRLQIEVNNLKG
jgi:hypothetical protein